MPARATSMGTTPHAWMASTNTSAPIACARSAMASMGMRNPVWNCTALTATSRTPRASSRSSAANPSSVRNASTSRKRSSSSKVRAACCQGVTLAGNSPRRHSTTSFGRQGSDSATSITLRVVFATKATSDAEAAPISRASRARSRSR
jgi:hypothetical protein